MSPNKYLAQKYEVPILIPFLISVQQTFRKQKNISICFAFPYRQSKEYNNQIKNNRDSDTYYPNKFE